MKTKLYGKAAYDADIASRPTYHDGTPRKPWEDLCPVARQSWNKKDKTNPMTYTVQVHCRSPYCSRQIECGTDRGAAYASYISEVNDAILSDWIRVSEIVLEECESDTECKHLAVSSEFCTMEKWAVRHSHDGNHYYEACDFRAEADADALKFSENNPIIYSIHE